MPDEEQDTAGPPPRPTPPKPKRDPIVIEGKAQTPAASARSRAGPAPAAPPPRGLARPIAAGAVGGAIGALLTIGGVWLFDTGPDPTVLARRMDALDAAQADAAAARKTSADRIAALEAAGAAAATEQKSLSDKLSALAAAPGDLVGRRKAAFRAGSRGDSSKRRSRGQVAQIRDAASASAQAARKADRRPRSRPPANETPVKTASPEAVPDPRVAALAADQASPFRPARQAGGGGVRGQGGNPRGGRGNPERRARRRKPRPARSPRWRLQTRVRAGERFATETCRAADDRRGRRRARSASALRRVRRSDVRRAVKLIPGSCAQDRRRRAAGAIRRRGRSGARRSSGAGKGAQSR